MTSSPAHDQLYALVADDELEIRRLVAASLAREGFICDMVADGEEALKRVSERPYHLVVTDLAMPKRHGHSLSVELMNLRDRPVVIILTGIMEPRLTKDLLARGVDDVQHKPIRFAAFAAKARSLVMHRLQQKQEGSTGQLPRTDSASSSSRSKVGQDEYERCLASLSCIPPMAKTAIELFRLTADDNSEPHQVVDVIMHDSALIAEVLKLANSTCFSPTGKKTSDISQAVTRLGLKRVGELALTLAAASSVAQEKIPFFPLSRVWQKCMAAGICMKVLTGQSGPQSSGLLCAAILRPMGRIMLASIFPDVYKQLLLVARKERRSLCSLEADAFPQSADAMAAKILAMWGVPEEIYHPLQYTSLPFASLESLHDPLRHRVELIKTAHFLGELIAEQFDSWNLIDLPPGSLFDRMGVESVDSLLIRCREDFDADLAARDSDRLRREERAGAAELPSNPTLAYKQLHDGPDFIPHLLGIAGVRLVDVLGEFSAVEEPVLVNAHDSAVPQAVARLRSLPPKQAVILADSQQAERLQACGRILTLPTTYGLLQDICKAMSCTEERAVPGFVRKGHTTDSVDAS